ncbi:MAG TPA: hypothetical protein VHD36_08320 [Pirellulales bacterium]|nr:hypothetical protein [Pirellulales bacterium]
MFDILVLAEAILVGALTAAAVMRLIAYRARREGARWSWAIGAGVLAASGVTDQWPHWPPVEDRARFLTLQVPLTIVVESLAAATRSRRMAWLLRFALAAIAAPILLHNSVYLTVLDGRDAAEWSPVEATTILAGLAAMAVLIWAALTALAARTSTLAVYSVLILDAYAAAVTVMLSGYFMGGLLGLGLAGAMTGAAMAAYNRAPLPPVPGSLGMGVIGIFAVVVVGLFFGNLSTALAGCLLLAPLLAWAVELPRLSAFAPRWRGVQRLAWVGVPLIVALTIAERKFAAAFAAHSSQRGVARHIDAADAP